MKTNLEINQINFFRLNESVCDIRGKVVERRDWNNIERITSF